MTPFPAPTLLWERHEKVFAPKQIVITEGELGPQGLWSERSGQVAAHTQRAGRGSDFLLFLLFCSRGEAWGIWSLGSLMV